MTHSADEIIERSFRGDATAKELEWLASWRRDALGNEQQYRRTVRLLAVARGLETPPSAARGRRAPSVASVLASSRELGTVAPRRRRVLAPSLLAAGILIAFALTGYAVRVMPRSKQAGDTIPGGIGYSTGPSEMATVQLSDGSVVRMAPGSKLRFIQRAAAREATLEGRAFFSIATLPSRPFRVHTQFGDATVLGTRFELAADSAELRLVVVSGRVALSGATNAVQVRGGERSGIRNGTALHPEPVPDAENMGLWVGRFLAFQSTPMNEVAREVAEMYGVRVVIADSILIGRTVTGTFIDRDAAQVLAVICPAVSASCASRTGEVVMTAR